MSEWRRNHAAVDSILMSTTRWKGLSSSKTATVAALLGGGSAAVGLIDVVGLGVGGMTLIAVRGRDDDIVHIQTTNIQP